MSRPGDGLRRVAARVCSERMQRRLIDPAVADLQAEVAAAHRVNRWHTLRALIGGYVSLVKVLAIAVLGDLLRGATTWEPHESAAARRGALVAALVTVVASALLLIPPMASVSVVNPVELATYIVPSTLPISVPLGFAIATAWAVHGAARRRRVGVTVLLVAAATSAAMFANLAWLTPTANQAFREAVVAQLEPPVPPPARGTNELLLTDLGQRLRQARAEGREQDALELEVAYYRKWTLSATPLAIAGLVLALTFRRTWTRRGLTAAACGVYAAYYAPMMFGEALPGLGADRPIVIEWAGLFLCAVAALLLICSRSLARRPA